MLSALRGSIFRSVSRKAFSVLIAFSSLDALSQSPVINQPPVPQSVFFGDPATFQVSASGSSPLNYQWYRNGSAIAGGTDSALLLAAVTGADHQASFSVRVTNLIGSVFSDAATLTVDFGVPGAPLTNRVLNYNSVWRFNQSNNLDTVN